MDTKQALADLGIGDDALTPDQRRALDEDGFFVAADVFTLDEVAEMVAEFDRLTEIEGDFGGHEVHIEPGAPRLANLFNKSPAFDRVLACGPTLAAAHLLLGDIRVFSLNARTPLKGQGQQPLHSDVPRRWEGDWWLVNSVIMLDDMAEDNGPTRVVPGSHKWVSLNVPDVNLFGTKQIHRTPADEGREPDDPLAPYPGEVMVMGKAGSVGVINGHIWHGGTTSASGRPRRVLHLSFARRDIPQQTDQRAHLTPELLARSSPAQRYLLDIEGAEPAVFGYPPLPTEARVWAHDDLRQSDA